MFALVLSLSASGIGLSGHSLSIRGTVSDTLFEGEVARIRDGTFLVAMDAGKWHIRYECEGDNFFYWESGQEPGSELVFTFGLFDFDAMKRAASELEGLPPTAKLATDPAFLGVGYVEIGPVPRASGSTPAIPVLYYAFCSGSYLDLHGPDPSELQIPFLVDGEARYFEYGIRSVRATQLIRHEYPPGLPRNLVFRHDGKHWTVRGPLQLPGPFKSGFTNAIFAAEGWTNVGGLTLPTHVRLDIHSPDLERMEVYKRRAIEAKVLSIGPVAETVTFRPRIEVPTQMSDARFMTPAEPLMRFRFTTNRWLVEDEELKVLPAFASAQEAQRTSLQLGQPSHVGVSGVVPSQKSRPPVALLVVLAVLMSIPIIAHLVSRRRRAANGGTHHSATKTKKGNI